MFPFFAFLCHLLFNTFESGHSSQKGAKNRKDQNRSLFTWFELNRERGNSRKESAGPAFRVFGVVRGLPSWTVAVAPESRRIMNATWLSTQPFKSAMNPPICVSSAPSHDGGYGRGVAVPQPRGEPR